MKKLLVSLLLIIALISVSFIGQEQQVEYKTITVIESIIPSGLGRSRMISAEETKNYRDYTSSGKNSKRNTIKNKDKSC